MRATALFFVVLPLVPHSIFSHLILALAGAAVILWDWWQGRRKK